MTCRMDALRDKEVINVKDGGRIGFVSDVEVDTKEARLTAVVVYGRLRLFGLFGREPDFVIPWGHGAGGVRSPGPRRQNRAVGQGAG